MTELTGEELLARLASTRLTSPAPPAEDAEVWDEDLIPQADPVSDWEQSEADREIERILGDVDILDAYRMWGGKGFTPNVGSRRENIMIRCPNPSHADADPSAWINLDDEVYCCGTCGNQGGDKFTIAAYNFGYPVPGYQGPSFRQLRRDMVVDLGYNIQESAGVEWIDTHEEPPEPDINVPEAPPIAPPADPTPEGSPAVTVGTPDEEPGPEHANGVTQEDVSLEAISHQLFIDWESLVPAETFLSEWMESVTIDDLPHEFYFWLGLQALGFAVGTNRLLADIRPVKPNLFLCLYGRTGVGKSRALEPYVRLIKHALPFDNEPYGPCSGVLVIPSPGSAEALLDSMKHTILDAENKPVGQSQVKGMLRIEEFAGFMARAARPGSTLKETLIELYDVLDSNVTHHSRGSGITIVENPYAQMVTTTQPRAINAFMRRTDTESGFLNRWLFIAGRPRVAPIAHGGRQPDLDDAVNYLKGIVRWADNRQFQILRGPALDVWTAFFNKELAAYKSGNVEQDSLLSRVDLTLKKVILLLTCNSRLDHPTPDIVEKAVSLYPYLLRTYDAVGGDIALDEQGQCQIRIIATISKIQTRTGHGPSNRDLVRAMGGKFPLDVMKRTLESMESLGIIEKVSTKGARGRPTVRYQYDDSATH